MAFDLAVEAICLGVVKLEPFVVTLHHYELFEVREEVHALDVVVMLDCVSPLGLLVVFDHVYEALLLAHEADLDDVVGELVPLQVFVVVHVYLGEELVERVDQAYLVLDLWQVVEHYVNELGLQQPFLVQLEILLYFRQFAVV